MITLPAGYSVTWSGQFEYLERAVAKLRIVIPATLMIIFVLLYLTFGRVDEALLILASVPFALIGGFWVMLLLGHAMSVATAVGFIALAGVSAEFGVIMLPVKCSSISREGLRVSMGPPIVRRSAYVNTRRPLPRRPMPGSSRFVRGVSTCMIEIGVAKPSAHGHAMISTATALTIA